MALITTVKVHAAPSPINNSAEPKQETVAVTERSAEPIKEQSKPKPKSVKKKVEAKKPPVKRQVAKPYKVSGNKETWLRQAGIPASQWKYVDYIVGRESSWNPLAVNPNGGACGLAQALPCSKIPGDWRNPVTSLKWQYSYVTQRYGGYAEAYSFWLANKWY